MFFDFLLFKKKHNKRQDKKALKLQKYKKKTKKKLELKFS